MTDVVLLPCILSLRLFVSPPGTSTANQTVDSDWNGFSQIMLVKLVGSSATASVDFSTAISSLQTRMSNAETFNSGTSLTNTLIGLRDVTGFSTMVSQFISVRDYTISTGGLFSYMTSINSRVSNLENLNGATPIVSSVTAALANTGSSALVTQVAALTSPQTMTLGGSSVIHSSQGQGANFEYPYYYTLTIGDDMNTFYPVALNQGVSHSEQIGTLHRVYLCVLLLIVR
jgi:hypothetical protein